MSLIRGTGPGNGSHVNRLRVLFHRQLFEYREDLPKLKLGSAGDNWRSQQSGNHLLRNSESHFDIAADMANY